MKKEIKVQGFAAIVIALLVVIRLYIIIHDASAMEAYDYYYLFRQTIYTIAWASLAWFLSEITTCKVNLFDILTVTRMKKASLLAMVACILKFLTSLVYMWPFQFSNLTILYNVFELLAWLLLAVFFYCFWKRKKLQESWMEQKQQ